MQLGCLAVLGALYMVWTGGQGLYTSMKNRTPMELVCENYDEVNPSKEWLKLTGCELNLVESSYMEQGGKVVELFIPARGPGEEEGDPIYVLLATKDRDLLAMANEMMALENEADFKSYLTRYRTQIYVRRDIEGLVRYGVDLDDGDRADLKGLDASLSPNFVIVDDGKKPGFAKSAGFLGGGVVLLLGVGAVAAGGKEG